MRAVHLPDLHIQDKYQLQGDPLHHLLSVVRIEAKEKLLLLSGQGLVVETQVESISKKQIELKFLSQKKVERGYQFDLALGMPKREALELCLREATELGLRKVYLVRSDFSQMRFPDEARVKSILASALEQSNAPYLPEVYMTDWKNIQWEEYGEIVLLDSKAKESSGFLRSSRPEKLLVVGPEGGFSPEEVEFLHALPTAKVVNLPTPILRSPTAVAAGAGLLIQSLLK
jgi:16S rRNA (uracil1498-N3)-methyltransferase